MTDSIPTSVLRINHHSAKHVADRWPYAAYGSNLSLRQMGERCESPELMINARLPGFKLWFAHFATIKKDDDSSVPVGIYKLNAADVDRMDRREGLGRSYDRFLVTVITEDERALRCFTYIKRDDRPMPPTPAYYGIIAEGYRDWHFESRRLRHARAASEKAYKVWLEENKDKERSWQQRAQDEWSRFMTKPRPHQQRLPFGNVDNRGNVRVPSNDDRQFNLVTGRCRKCGKMHPHGVIVCPTESVVPKIVSISMSEVEWGQRDGQMFWRIKGERAWYLDMTSDADSRIGMVRGTLATTLPGSQAFKPKEGPTT